MIKGGGTRAFFTGEKTTPQKFSVMIRWGDTQAIGRIWNAAKMQIRADTDLKGDAFMAAVEDLTLKVVNETQPTYHMKDRSDIGMSTNLFLREATSFSTQTNKIFNMVYKSMYRFAASDKTPEDRKKLYKTLFVVAVNMALVSMIDEARERFRKRKSSGRQLLANYMRNVVGTIYFAPLFWPSAASKIQRGTFAGWDISTPTLSTADSFIDGVAELWLGIEDIFTKEVYQSGKNEGKSKAAVQLKRAFLNISDTITTVMMGVPVARPAKDIGLLVEYASGLVDSLEITGAEGVPSSRGGPPRNPLQPFSPLKPLKPLPPLKALKPLKPLR
jgi:VanZ family protein